MEKIKYIFIGLFLFIINQTGFGQRFPEPEFETGHVPPELQAVAPRALQWEYLDVIVLFIALSVMSWFVIKKRSRKGIFWTSIFSIIYFGIIRLGCVCSIGSIQNVTMSFFQSDFVIPLTIVAFFVLPLIFTLFFGRTFCAGVCFMGAAQDLVNIKHISLPNWLSKPLGAIPYIYLMLAIILAATGADFIICRYDPFIGFFRMNATFGMFVFGAAILVLGVFIGRPYCRFICPYGVILNWLSKLSFWHTTITPSNCIQCKLCDTSCPVDAIKKPVNIKPESGDKGKKRLILLFILLPFFMFSGGFIVSRLYKPISTIHPTVKLAEEIKWEKDNNKKTETEESLAFHSTGVPREQLFKDAADIQKFYLYATWIGGALLGLFFGIGLLKTAIVRKQIDYEPDKGNCVSCGKCYKYCPVEKQV
ncbi:MAG: 4Fe-4S binding protein [Paludibacter sp.]|nr:4Fe-4S binding protein [Paludibacter sp.]